MSATLAGADSGYCAFEVHITDPSGAPVTKIPVGIAQRQHSIAETLTGASGIAKLCDAPLDRVDIFVGFDACGSVLVRQVKPLWLQTKKIFVTYSRSYCDHFVTFATQCHIILRVKDESDQPLTGARFEAQTPEKNRGIGISDAFGRLFRILEGGGKLEGSVTKEGYETALVSDTCQLGDEDVGKELVVVLRKR